MERNTARMSDYLPGIIVAALGIAVNVFLFMEQRNRTIGLYAEYEQDLSSSLTNPAMKYYADWNLIYYHTSQIVLYFIVFCAAVYLLYMILPKIRLISVLIPMAELTMWMIALWNQRGMETRDEKWTLFSILLSVLVFLLVWWAVFTRRTSLSVLAFIVSLGYCAETLLFHAMGNKAAEELMFGNSAGNTLLLMLMMISDRIVFRREYGVPHRSAAERTMSAAPAYDPAAAPAYSPAAAPAYDPAASPASSAVSSPAGVPRREGSGFLAQQEYLIDEKVRAFGTAKVFKICDTSGNMTGFIREGISGGARTARAFLGKGISNLQAVTYEVMDASETLQFSVTQKGGIGTASIFDTDGSMIAELVRGSLKDAAGNNLGSMKTSFSLKAKISVLDPEGNEMGMIAEKWNGLAKELFSTADKYYVSVGPETSREQKIMVLGTALIYEMILGNK